MVSFTSITIVALISLATQASAGNAVGKVIGKVAGPAANAASNAASSNNNNNGNNHKMRRVVRAAPDPLTSIPDFDACVSAAKGSAISTVHNPDKSVLVVGVPQICIQAVTSWNARPDIADLNKVEGEVSIFNGTTIQLSGLDSAVHAELESL